MYTYNFSSVRIVTNIKLPFLSSFHVGEISNPNIVQNYTEDGSFINYYTGKGIIEDKEYNVKLCSNSYTYRLQIVDIAELLITLDGKSICLVNSRLNTNSHTFLSAFTGPALILALAINNIFCIHSSAVKINNKVAMFIGESGYGKSTLADKIRAQNKDIKRISDDILPLYLKGNKLYALPDFPQLKLKPEEQYSPEPDEELKISHIYLLTKQDDIDKIVLNNMESKKLIQNLIKQTISSVLFDKDILNSHLEFCAGGLDSLIPKELIFRRNTSEIPGLCKIILDDLLNTA